MSNFNQRLGKEVKEEIKILPKRGRFTKFQPRVWEQTLTGWSSREATAEDHERRRAVADKLRAIVIL